jgi:hypothetical protein
MTAPMEKNLATEAFLDAFLALTDGKEGDELVFVDGALRDIAEHLGVVADWPEIEPMTARQFRLRYIGAKNALAAGRGPFGFPLREKTPAHTTKEPR